MNMTLSADESGVRLFGDPDRNAPSTHEEFFNAVGQLASAGSPGWKFGIEFHRDRFDPHRAAVSWLRAGYLAVFAKFGYRVVLNSAFHVVRERIASPGSENPPLFGIRLLQAEPVTRALIVLSEPAEIAGGLAVQIGGHVVLLPRPGDMQFYARVHGRKGDPVQLRGTPVPWPSRPEFLHDMPC
ncbi:MAG: hypothetical protein AB1806_15310 [Acidobacteriota bacterium]